MNFVINDELLKEILSELGYSMSSSSDAKSRVISYIKDGAYKINQIAGAEVDFDTDRDARSLLKSYCIYADAHILDMWSENYSTDINGLHHNYRVKEFKENADS